MYPNLEGVGLIITLMFRQNNHLLEELSVIEFNTMGSVKDRAHTTKIGT